MNHAISHARASSLHAALTAAVAFIALFAAETAVAASTDVWTIEAGQIDPQHYFGATMANGMIGMLSSPVPFRTEQTLIYGAYEKLAPTYVTCIVSSFDFLDLAFSIDGTRIERLDQVSNFRQRLHLKEAAFATSFDYGESASITYSVRALRQMPYTALLEVEISAKRPITISPVALLRAPPKMIEVVNHDNTVQLRHEQHNPMRLRAARGKTEYGSHSVAAAHAFVFEEPPATAPTVAQDAAGLQFTKSLAAGTTYRFAVVGSSMTSAHVPDPLSEAQRLTAFAVFQGKTTLVSQHEGAWRDLWNSNIIIKGDDATQRDVHNMLYHMYSFVREGTSYSIPPMGLSRGQWGYLGHIFWDAEVWMVPALAALRPELARSMLEYRYERMPAARKNALAHGFRGVMFPWESAASGDDETPSGAATGPLQHHVTGGVGVAAWNYYRVTQDREWLRDRGYALISGTADFWASRVTRNGPGRYDINNVVAADEYAENVDNNAYTNAVARENLAAATAAAKILGIAHDPNWEHVRQNIPILKFPNGVTREHASYNGEQTKQADANLLAYPLKHITDSHAIRRDLDYYISRSDDVMGPAMTKSIFAILYQRLGMPDKAYDLFKQGYQPNLRPPFATLAENASSSNPYFATGAGGLLQALLYGFGGLDITDRGLVQQSGKLPAKWQSLTLTGIGPQRRTYTIRRSASEHEMETAVSRETQTSDPGLLK